MICVTLSSGFEVTIPEESLDDMELLDELTLLDSGATGNISLVVSRLLGEQKPALYAHLRRADGRVRVTDVMGAVKEILEGVKDGKKS